MNSNNINIKQNSDHYKNKTLNPEEQSVEISQSDDIKQANQNETIKTDIENQNLENSYNSNMYPNDEEKLSSDGYNLSEKNEDSDNKAENGDENDKINLIKKQNEKIKLKKIKNHLN